MIIGEDLVLGESGVPESNKASYYDRNGFATASKQELDRYVKNIYYVLLTRGILGTHIYVKSPKLRDYFSKFISQSGQEVLRGQNATIRGGIVEPVSRTTS